MKTLIVYYSFGGNTESIAHKIHSVIDADFLKIETLEPYIGSYDEIITQGQEEVNKKEKPDLQSIDIDPEEYDCIIIGSPTRRYTIAPAILSFLSIYDLSDKIIIPFVTCGGWPGTSIEDIKNECIGAEFKCEKEIIFDADGGHQCLTDDEEIEDRINQIKGICN